MDSPAAKPPENSANCAVRASINQIKQDLRFQSGHVFKSFDWMLFPFRVFAGSLAELRLRQTGTGSSTALGDFFCSHQKV